jgi:hypothetical protein
MRFKLRHPAALREGSSAAVNSGDRACAAAASSARIEAKHFTRRKWRLSAARIAVRKRFTLATSSRSTKWRTSAGQAKPKDRAEGADQDRRRVPEGSRDRGCGGDGDVLDRLSHLPALHQCWGRNRIREITRLTLASSCIGIPSDSARELRSRRSPTSSGFKSRVPAKTN